MFIDKEKSAVGMAVPATENIENSRTGVNEHDSKRG